MITRAVTVVYAGIELAGAIVNSVKDWWYTKDLDDLMLNATDKMLDEQARREEKKREQETKPLNQGQSSSSKNLMQRLGAWGNSLTSMLRPGQPGYNYEEIENKPKVTTMPGYGGASLDTDVEQGHPGRQVHIK